MLTVWRMVTVKRADSAFSGEGARLYGGRWNPKGVPLVYTASTQSLATLEMLVQDGKLLAKYVMIPAKIPTRLRIDRITPDELPEGWRDAESKGDLQRIGADWCKRQSSAVLVVPSVVIPQEMNYLLNPLHPSFAKIQIGEPHEFTTDLALLRTDGRSAGAR